MEHGLEYTTLYVKKYITHLVACSGRPLVRDGPLGAPAFVKQAYSQNNSTENMTVVSYPPEVTGNAFFLIIVTGN